MKKDRRIICCCATLVATLLIAGNLYAQQGTPVPASSAVNDQTPGSVLFYNYVTSDGTTTGGQNTDIAITNTNPSSPAVVSLFLVSSVTGSVASHIFVCLAQGQTASVIASDLAPGTTGYALAVAVDASGCPLSFNYLVGDEYVKLDSEHRASLNAEAFSALFTGSLACTTTASLAFDGVTYSQAPRALSVSKLGSLMDNNEALLVVNRFGGDLTGSLLPAGTFFGQLFGDTSAQFNFAFSGNYQFICPLTNSFPLIAPAFSNTITAAHIGSMRFWATNDVAILGAILNHNSSAAISRTAFSGGQNLHRLTLTSSATYVIPVTLPPC